MFKSLYDSPITFLDLKVCVYTTQVEVERTLHNFCVFQFFSFNPRSLKGVGKEEKMEKMSIS